MDLTPEKKDPPIEPLEYRNGVKVVDIGDIRVARGKSRRPYPRCKHRRMMYDQQERRIWCADCERDIESFDAFVHLTERFSRQADILSKREKDVAEAEQFKLRSRAAKALDEVWRTRNMVPMCPTCFNGLLPEMFAGGCGGRLGREYAVARLRAKPEPTPPTKG